MNEGPLDSTLGLLALGSTLGLYAGLSPGPLLALVLGRALSHGPAEGVRVALAPLLTDPPIVALALLFADGVTRWAPGLALLSMLGAAFLAWLALGALRPVASERSEPPRPARSIRDGLLANLLSPHPYLFWLSVGAPAIHRGLEIGTLAPISFVAGFFTFLVGTKVVVALIAGRTRRHLRGRAYTWAQRILGIALLVFSFFLLREGAVRLASIG